MNTFNRFGAFLLLFILLGSSGVSAATNPPLGAAAPYSVLSSTYTNTAVGTVLNGDLGYTNGPAMNPTVNGTTHVANATYNQAGIDQNAALANLNGQPCTFSFAPGAVDLATDVTNPNGAGNFIPGVYCIDGAASVGGGGTITLTGSGTYIFRMNGALTTSANSIVAFAGGASACDVWWTPTAAATLGANTTFGGTIIAPSGITSGSAINWAGRALAFGGTVSTTTDTINTVPLCATPSTTTTTIGGAGTGSTTTGLPNTGGSAEQTSTSVLGVSAVIMLAVYLSRKGLKSFFVRS